jgi:hypothetical protein
MNSISFNTSFTHLLLLKIALVVSSRRCTSITWVTPRHDWAIGLKSGKGTGVGPLVASTLRFIQMRLPLLPLKLMGQSRRGVTQTKEDQMCLLAISRRTCASGIWGAPRLDWPIGFSGSKGICRWINLGITVTSRRCTSMVIILKYIKYKDA